MLAPNASTPVRVPIRVTHIITGLEAGGAQTMLWRLIAASDHSRLAHDVISLTDDGPIATRIRKSGVRVRSLGMRRRVTDLGAFFRLMSWLRADQPDVVQTWMTHADFVGGIAAKAASCRRIAWGIHHSEFVPGVDKQLTVLVARICGLLSGWVPTAIVCCSEASRRAHLGMRYRVDRMRLIPNGFDLNAFSPSPRAKAELREELGVSANAVLVGRFGRFHPQKDYRTLTIAMAWVMERNPDVRLVLCGDGVDSANKALSEWLTSATIAKSTYLLGHRDDMTMMTAAVDIAVSSSSAGEAFPLVIGEAMACAVPCVATDVGDSAELLGDARLIVPAKDADALAGAILRLVEIGPDERSRIGLRGRRRVEEKYSIETVCRLYSELYEELAG